MFYLLDMLNIKFAASWNFLWKLKSSVMIILGRDDVAMFYMGPVYMLL